MVNHQYGKIYKVVCRDTNKVYIGSTAQRLLCYRLGNHRSDFKNFLIGKMNYITVFDIMKNNNYYIKLIEKYPCESKEELKAREQEYIDSTVCVNKIRAYNSPEYYKEYKHQHYEKHKEQYLENCKEYVKANKGKTKEYQAQYYNEHKEEINQKNKEYHYKNRDAVLDKKREYYD